MIVLGLTGSIGMGKTTTAAMFAARGVPVFDADEAVHRLYSGPLAARVEALFPGTTENGVVRRDLLSRRVLGDPDALRRLEALVHPAVREAERAFLHAAREDGAPLVVLDIPLLYETGRERDVDAVVVVTADPEIQRERVFSRPGMTAERFAAMRERQLPDAEKRRRADVVIDTGGGLAAADAAVAAIVSSPPQRGG